MVGVKLGKKKINPSLKVREYLPDEIIQCVDDIRIKEDTILVKAGKFLGYDKFKLPIIAGATGRIHIMKNAKKIKIDNIKEDAEHDLVPYQYTYTKTEISHLFKVNGIIGYESKIPAYLKYQTNKKVDTLIINAALADPYSEIDAIIGITYPKEIVKTALWLIKAMNIKECFIAVPSKIPLLKDKLQEAAYRYKKIKIIEVPNIYPIGWERNIVRYVKHVSYNKNPLEKGIIVNNIKTVYDMHTVLHKQTPPVEKLIIVRQDDRTNYMKVRIGTKIEDILNYLEIDYKKKTILTGTAMRNKKISIKDSIDATTTNIIITNYKKKEESICIKCGKCTSKCPVKISPISIHEAVKNDLDFKKLHPESCIECGICSYICPANIDVRKSVIKAKERR